MVDRPVARMPAPRTRRTCRPDGGAGQVGPVWPGGVRGESSGSDQRARSAGGARDETAGRSGQGRAISPVEPASASRPPDSARPLSN
ncbi:hypothetical protein ONO86_01150 [Micromonospora noduli]|nr:hypothetical protein ONO86_01150 [Micromonospora noduli]